MSLKKIHQPNLEQQGVDQTEQKVMPLIDGPGFELFQVDEVDQSRPVRSPRAYNKKHNFQMINSK